MVAYVAKKHEIFMSFPSIWGGVHLSFFFNFVLILCEFYIMHLNPSHLAQEKSKKVKMKKIKNKNEKTNLAREACRMSPSIPFCPNSLSC